MTTPRPVLVVDFGAQYAQLIARRVREADVYSETRAALDAGRRDDGAQPGRGDPVRRPVQRLRAGRAAGRPGPVRGRRAGVRHLLRLPGDGAGARRRGHADRPARVRRHAAAVSPVIAGSCCAICRRRTSVWMSHGDRVSAAPPGFTVTAGSPGAPVAAFEAPERGFAGVQFHPEVAHTPGGQAVLQAVPLRHRRARAHLDHRQHHRRAGGADPGAGRRRAGDLRAVRRRRLGGGRGAGAPGGRRPVDVRLRRPRPAARRRGRAGRDRLRRRPPASG